MAEEKHDYVVLTDTNFDEKTKNGNWIVDMWAPWCGPCRLVGPVIEVLGKEYRGKLHVGKVNVDENSSTAEKFGVMSIPTILFIKDGEKLEELIGARPKESYVEKISELFGV